MEEEQSSSSNIIVVVIIVAVVIFLLFLLFQNKSNSGDINKVNTEDTAIDENTQVVEVTVKGGYTPNYIEAKANTKTVLKLISNQAFDCSAAFQIPALAYSKFLPPNGETLVNLGEQAAGTEITAACSMGMYLLKIKFV